ncbi:hypothetical protein FGB62_494g02 [Gracilaria domingensis]|nr:hypothetical protein FGB62_494g02 [Gracilaria domingensis]
MAHRSARLDGRRMEAHDGVGGRERQSRDEGGRKTAPLALRGGASHLGRCGGGEARSGGGGAERREVGGGERPRFEPRCERRGSSAVSELARWWRHRRRVYGVAGLEHSLVRRARARLGFGRVIGA